MTPKLNTFTIVKSDREQMMDLLTTLAGLAILYYTVNPEILDDCKSWLREHKAKLTYQLNVWRTLRGIQSLPETEQ